jgi:hypothetical protein
VCITEEKGELVWQSKAKRVCRDVRSLEWKALPSQTGNRKQKARQRNDRLGATCVTSRFNTLKVVEQEEEEEEEEVERKKRSKRQ